MTATIKAAISSTTEIKQVSLAPAEFLMLLTVLKITKSVANDKNDKDEEQLMTELINTLLNYKHEDDDTAKLELSKEVRFMFWLALDSYRDFCIESKYKDEKRKVEVVMKKFT